MYYVFITNELRTSKQQIVDSRELRTRVLVQPKFWIHARLDFARDFFRDTDRRQFERKLLS
jgi:hypothetical protein